MNEAVAQHAHVFSNLDGVIALGCLFLVGVLIFRLQNWSHLRKNACRPCRRGKHGDCTGMHPWEERANGRPMACRCLNKRAGCYDQAIRDISSNE